MEEPVNLYFVGTAGSGKTTLTKQFKVWMDSQGYDSIIVNLDPGVEDLPYSPDVDIRDWIQLREIMVQHSVGPNAAQILAADMLALNAKEVKEVIDKFKTNYILFDTPGQIELFAFRESSRVITEILGAKRALIVYLFDPILAQNPVTFVSQLMLCATVQFRFDIPTGNVLTKIDILSKEKLELIKEWSEDPYRLMDALTTVAPSSPYPAPQVSIEFLKSLENLGVYKAVIPVSAVEFFGLEDIYNTVQQIFAGGEDLEK